VKPAEFHVSATVAQSFGKQFMGVHNGVALEQMFLRMIQGFPLLCGARQPIYRLVHLACPQRLERVQFRGTQSFFLPLANLLGGYLNQLVRTRFPYENSNLIIGRLASIVPCEMLNCCISLRAALAISLQETIAHATNFKAVIATPRVALRINLVAETPHLTR
jgi:hypothetical protein